MKQTKEPKTRIEKRRKKAVKISLATFSVLVSLLVGIITVSAFKVTEAKTEETLPVEQNTKKELEPRKERPVKDILTTEEVEKEEEIVETSERLNILVLGVDSREENITGRTDAILLVSLDKKTENIDMISIPRDSYVELIGRGSYDKINHAFSFGGSDMTIATVENLFDVEIDHHVVFNFTSFVDIIDALGGIEVDVPFNFSEQDSQGNPNRLFFYQGLQTLNGEEALAYSRMRKHDPTGDVGRGQRQQEVIKSTLQKAKDIDSIPTYIKLFNVIRKNIETDVGIFDIHNLVPYIKTLGSVETHTLGGDGMMIRGVYYYQIDSSSLNNIKTKLKQ